MRVSLCLLGNMDSQNWEAYRMGVQSLEAVLNADSLHFQNVVSTSDSPLQSLRDILSDGSLFHMFRQNRYKIVLATRLPNENGQIYSFAKSLVDDADVVYEMDDDFSLPPEHTQKEEEEEEDNVFLCLIVNDIQDVTGENTETQKEALTKTLNSLHTTSVSLSLMFDKETHLAISTFPKPSQNEHMTKNNEKMFKNE